MSGERNGNLAVGDVEMNTVDELFGMKRFRKTRGSVRVGLAGMVLAKEVGGEQQRERLPEGQEWVAIAWKNG